MLVIHVPLCSHPIKILRAQAVFLEEYGKKEILISHLKILF